MTVNLTPYLPLAAPIEGRQREDSAGRTVS
ncbi:hypothetical protein RCH06_003450 [Polaromonas sp. CG_9.5]|nr:hypothetical protein [Polaromonas sp. CG_9.5]